MTLRQHLALCDSREVVVGGNTPTVSTFLFQELSQEQVMIYTNNPLAPELFFFNFSTPCIQNVNNTETKQVSITKQTAF